MESPDTLRAASAPALLLHDDWAEDWAPSIQSPVTRDAIEANPRLVDRPLTDLAQRLGVPPMGPLTHAQSDVLLAVNRDPERFLRVLGLAVHAGRLARLIDGPRLRDLATLCQLADIAIAVKCHSQSEASPKDETDFAGLVSGAPKLGARLLLVWAAEIGPGVEGRLRLLLPKTVPARDEVTPAGRTEVTTLVEAVAGAILGEAKAG